MITYDWPFWLPKSVLSVGFLQCWNLVDIWTSVEPILSSLSFNIVFINFWIFNWELTFMLFQAWQEKNQLDLRAHLDVFNSKKAKILAPYTDILKVIFFLDIVKQSTCSYSYGCLQFNSLCVMVSTKIQHLSEFVVLLYALLCMLT